jgi:diguanylate cyclase (GGDEF)-like protein
MDIDYFKDFNDRYGQISGDDCLVALSRALKDGLKRPGDLAARYGGEELAVLLPNTDSHSASLIAEILRQAVESLAINHGATRAAGQQIVTVSAGLATYIPSDKVEPSDLISHADRALYQAKAAGRNQFVINEAVC